MNEHEPQQQELKNNEQQEMLNDIIYQNDYISGFSFCRLVIIFIVQMKA